MNDNDRTASNGDVDQCAKPERLALLQQSLQTMAADGFGAAAVAATYRCEEHGCHCAFAVGCAEDAGAADILSLIDGLRANLRGLEARMQRRPPLVLRRTLAVCEQCWKQRNADRPPCMVTPADLSMPGCIECEKAPGTIWVTMRVEWA